MPHRPSWYRDGSVVVANSATCGLNKDGLEQYIVDPVSGRRSDQIDDKLAEDVFRIREGRLVGGAVFLHPAQDMRARRIMVPCYYDDSTESAARDFVERLPGFACASLGALVERGILKVFEGHGSPSLDQRVGEIPYIKVSDLRAGQVNINPTNRVPLKLAREEYWGGESSGLQAYDLISPQRASKNIGEFCVLMPGQEQVVLTREVIVVRPGLMANFDHFFLMWALSLSVVRAQWRRVIFMQTNREDVGTRYREILVPVPLERADGERVSAVFRDYYLGIEAARNRFIAGLSSSGFQHHIFLGNGGSEGLTDASDE